jgi:effector-binding domain-containing protein
MDPKIFDFEIGVPVSSPVTASGRVQPGQLPAAKVARTIYHGSYEGLGPAWGEFDAWINAQGLSPAPNLWECYVSGPESSADPSTWQTELNRPLIG